MVMVSSLPEKKVELVPIPDLLTLNPLTSCNGKGPEVALERETIIY